MVISNNKFNNKFQAIQHQKKISWSSIFTLCGWIAILSWIGFLLYCVRSGLSTTKQVTTLIEDVTLLDSTALRGSSQHPPPPHPPHQTPSSSSSSEDVGGGGGGDKSGSVDAVQDGDSGITSASGSASGIGSNRASPDDIFVVFSTDCTEYQDWQSLVLFYSAKLIQQPGIITRIASGCDEKKQHHLQTLYQQLYGDYCTVHFTPDYKRDNVTKRKYDFYNKPWGIKHWLEFGHVPSGAIVALLDPDMVFLRPITRQIASKPYLIDKPLLGEIMENVTIGRPVGQLYGLGAPWAQENHRHFNKYRICGEDSPCVKPTVQYGELHYSVGPPYVMIKEDFVRLAETWTRFVPR